MEQTNKTLASLDQEVALRVKHLPPVIQALAAQIGAYANERIAAATEPLLARIEALEASVPEYRGTFEPGRSYRRNSLVTDSGSVWIALRPTATQPPSDDWQLCVKAGRPGRDAPRIVEAHPPPARLQ